MTARRLVLPLFLVAACSPPDPVTATLPTPSFASDAPLRGAYETRLDLAVVAARRALRDDYGALDADIFHLDEGATWETVEAFYADALAASGFARTARASDDPDRYRLGVWEHGGSEAVAVVFVSGRPGDPKAFLVVLTPRG